MVLIEGGGSGLGQHGNTIFRACTPTVLSNPTLCDLLSQNVMGIDAHSGETALSKRFLQSF